MDTRPFGLRGGTRGLIALALLVSVLIPAAATASPTASLLVGPCAPGASYDPACDVDHDGDVDVNDIMLTAGHFNRRGTWTSDNNHNHLGQSWTGNNNRLAIQGTFGLPAIAPLVLTNSGSGDGLWITEAGFRGLTVTAAGTDGVYVGRAGTPSSQTSSNLKNGFEVAGAENHGVYVGTADQSGVFVNSAGGSGLFVDLAAGNGVNVATAGAYGVHVNAAGIDGVRVGSAGFDGVRVGTAGNPTTSTASNAKNGFEVAGAQGNGLYVGRADLSGVHINSAGGSGVSVVSAASTGISVVSAGGSGVSVNSAAGDGFRVYRAGSPTAQYELGSSNGVTVAGAEGFGFVVGRADKTGVFVNESGTTGVYANTTRGDGEWGLYTPDKISGSNVLLHSLSLVAQIAGPGGLAAGNVVAVAGVADPVPGSTVQVPLVRLANGDAAGVVGIVQSRLALTQQPGHRQPVGGETQAEAAPAELRSVDGPAQAGDYVAITVMGAAQAKVAPGESTIAAGARLTAAANGTVRPLQTRTVDGMIVAEGAPVLGVALGPAAGGLVWVLVNPQ